MPLLTRGAPWEFFNGHGRAPPAHPSPPQGSFAPLTTTHLFWLAQRQKAICMAMCFGLTKNHCSVPQWASLRGPIGLGHKGNPLAIKFIGHTPSPQDHWTTSQKDFVLCRIAWDLFCGHGPWPSAPWIIGPRRNGIPYVAIATAHELLNFTYGHCPWPQRPPPCEHWRASQ